MYLPQLTLSIIRQSTVLLLGILGIFLTAPSAQAGYRYEGVGFYAEAASTETNTPVYRFYNTQSGDHFFTTSENEKSVIQTTPSWNYIYEGIGFYTKLTPDAETTPIYRFFNTVNGEHFFTPSLEEKTGIENHPSWNYRYEGISFYADIPSASGATPLYRFFSTEGYHFYTMSEIEKNTLINGRLGPSISVGLWSVSKSDSVTTPFKIRGNKDYTIIDSNGNRLATIPAATITRVSYGDSGNLKIFDSISDTLVNQKVTFQAADDNNADMIFDIFQPGSSYDQFRGQVFVRYSDTSKNLWIINTLPLEHYVWGIGEITGTGDANYNRTMTTAFRTYGLWKIYYSTTYASEGFTVVPTSANQIYYGYDWETSHPNIKSAAEDTLGRVAKYGTDIALSPYSSWTDGRTRSFQEVWGSTLYPWCQSVADPHGKHPTLDTAALQFAGNHMVGLSAHGALSLATNSRWDWTQILPYYLTGISIPSVY